MTQRGGGGGVTSSGKMGTGFPWIFFAFINMFKQAYYVYLY